ncbi:tRNA threonylcarbamoyladenosine dehydratase, partial [bacterium]|nr:tRNA threonylcarbamoyladenosine dehydratase [bacterium]
GIGNLRLVDFDLLTASSLNRHPSASLEDVGKAKTEILTEFLNRVCPDTDIEPIKQFFHTDTADSLLDPLPNFVVDAIDSSNPKCALLEECFNRKINVVSSMGASSHSDFSTIRTGDLFDSTICPLASRIRKFLRRRNVGRGIQAVWSVEPHGPHMPPDIDDRTIDRGRIRNRLPSSISMPGAFGYTIASMILDCIAEKGSQK